MVKKLLKKITIELAITLVKIASSLVLKSLRKEKKNEIQKERKEEISDKPETE